MSALWSQYLALSADHPFALAFAQFFLLGTLGEALSAMVRARAFKWPFGAVRTLLKAAGWGLLGLYIKVMFLAASATQTALLEHEVLPEIAGRGLGGALACSTLMNVMLGPSMVLLHRLIDNLTDRMAGEKPLGWAGLGRALGTLIWLWIPLHTFTFTQPREVRVGIAAGLSVVLGVVLGWMARR